VKVKLTVTDGEQICSVELDHDDASKLAAALSAMVWYGTIPTPARMPAGVEIARL